MYFKGNDFIKQRAADIDRHDEWQTKHYFNSSAQGTETQTPSPPVTTKPVVSGNQPVPVPAH
jgi:hypothetical protein